MAAPASRTLVSPLPLAACLWQLQAGKTKFGDDFHQTFSCFLVAVVIVIVIVVPAVGACP